MRHDPRILIRTLPALAAACAFSAAVPAHAASPLTILHSFCKLQNCEDGEGPLAGLLRDSSGRLYGTTNSGGKSNDGVVFRLDPDGGGYKEHILWSLNGDPTSDVIMDTVGNLYGTQQYGGKYGRGSVFRLSPVGGGRWSYATLHSFTANSSELYDGPAGLSYQGQTSGALWDGSSPLYGTARGNGKYYNGVAYQLTHDGSNWPYHVIHDFQTSSEPNELLVDSSGNLFGTTNQGGGFGGGLLFKLAHGTWKQTVFHQFCQEAQCADGGNPVGRLIMDGAGNLFGSARNGGTGAKCPDSKGCGVVFERQAGGGYSVIYDFCNATNCPDGLYPNAPIMDGAGHLFGTTVGDENPHAGTIFELTKANGHWIESTLYDFGDGLGITPTGSLVMNPAGDLFGTTFSGGRYSLFGGTVFRLTR